LTSTMRHSWYVTEALSIICTLPCSPDFPPTQAHMVSIDSRTTVG
jgi:hypothetical protein